MLAQEVEINPGAHAKLENICASWQILFKGGYQIPTIIALGHVDILLDILGVVVITYVVTSGC